MLRAIDEGKTADAGGITGCTSSYYYFQKTADVYHIDIWPVFSSRYQIIFEIIKTWQTEKSYILKLHRTIMAKRTRYEQTCHNESVRRRAAGLEVHGWKVKADVSGYDRPKVLNGSRPDIIARKGTRTKIVEVETVNTRFTDREQQRNLRQYARTHKKTEFNVRTCYT